MHRDERRACCPHCGQPMAGVRFGVALSPHKLRIFDLVARAGAAGISGDALFDRAYRGRPSSRQAMRANIWKINGLLEETDYRIRGTCGSASIYRLVRL